MIDLSKYVYKKDFDKSSNTETLLLEKTKKSDYYRVCYDLDLQILIISGNMDFIGKADKNNFSKECIIDNTILKTENTDYDDVITLFKALLNG